MTGFHRPRFAGQEEITAPACRRGRRREIPVSGSVARSARRIWSRRRAPPRSRRPAQAATGDFRQYAPYPIPRGLLSLSRPHYSPIAADCDLPAAADSDCQRIRRRFPLSYHGGDLGSLRRAVQPRGIPISEMLGLDTLPGVVGQCAPLPKMEIQASRSTTFGHLRTRWHRQLTGAHMIRHSAATILVVATIAAAALTQATYLRAPANTTAHGASSSRPEPDRAAPPSFSGKISNGIIYYGGGGPINFNGRVRSNGAAWVRVASGSNYGVARGRLTVGRGSGTWRGKSADGYCAGTWSAMRV